MLPRGEVGLIFATLGLQTGVLGDDLYAALLLVVLVTTLVAPQLLKARHHHLRAGALAERVPHDAPVPEGGWLRIGQDSVGLAAHPPAALALPLAVDAAIFIARRRPEPDLLDWLADSMPTTTPWPTALTPRLLDVIEQGNRRSWRFLETVGVLDAALPELAEALRHRGGGGASLDGTQWLRPQIVERLRLLDEDDPLALEARALQHVDRLFLGGFLVDSLDEVAAPGELADAILQRLGVEPTDRKVVVAMVEDRDLLWSAAHQPRALAEDSVLQLAAHLDSPERARGLYVLSALRGADRERWEHQRLRTLHELVQAALADDSLSGSEARSLTERRKVEAAQLLADAPGALERLEAAPRAYLLRTPPPALVRHARLLDPPPVREPRCLVTDDDVGGWWVDVAWHDDAGRLAEITSVLADHGHVVDDAVLATWPDGSILDAFHVPAGDRPVGDALVASLRAAGREPMSTPALPDAEVEADSTASPWHTICEVRCTDRPGLLNALAAAFAAAGIEVRSAQVSAHDGLVIDRFEVTDRDGAKLREEDVARFGALVRSGVTTRRRWFGRRTARAAAQA